ncbi:hypothetical protein MRX96_002623 [Rhipicephalus microplus]
MWLLSRLLFIATVVVTERHAVNGYVSIAEVSLQNSECDFNRTKKDAEPWWLVPAAKKSRVPVSIPGCCEILICN